MEVARTGSVVDVGHGATFGGDVAYVNLLGLDLDLWAKVDKVALKQALQQAKGHVSESTAHVSSARCVQQLVQGATFSLNVTEVQFDAGNHDLGTRAAARLESYRETADEWRREE